MPVLFKLNPRPAGGIFGVPTPHQMFLDQEQTERHPDSSETEDKTSETEETSARAIRQQLPRVKDVSPSKVDLPTIVEMHVVRALELTIGISRSHQHSTI